MGESEPIIPAPPISSTITTTASGCNYHLLSLFRHQLLEINLISAQNLPTITKSMRSYAVAWIDSRNKQTTCIDSAGHTNPTWNDKFSFRIDNESSRRETSAVTVEIYAASWFRDILIGSVQVPISNLVNMPMDSQISRFVTLQIRRPSGNPQGILNMGFSLVDEIKQIMHSGLLPANDKIPEEDKIKKEDENMVLEIDCDDFSYKPCSTVYDQSEICSDIGPSASIVAAEIAKKSRPPAAGEAKETVEIDESPNSILEDLTAEQAIAKGLVKPNIQRWKPEHRPTYDGSGWEKLESKSKCSRRRNSDGGGSFSCFVYGIGFTIACGAKR